MPSNRSLVIVFEVEPAFNGLPEGVFAGQFHNEDTEVHAWSEVEGVGHYRWLQGPMNHLFREQQLEFIAELCGRSSSSCVGIDQRQQCFSETSKLKKGVMLGT